MIFHNSFNAKLLIKEEYYLSTYGIYNEFCNAGQKYLNLKQLIFLSALYTADTVYM